MNIIITGIHGFVGTNLTAALHEKHQIYGVDIVSPEAEGIIHTYTWEDVKSGKLPEADVIIHLASIVHDIKNKIKEEVVFNVNTGLTKVIYDYFCQSTAKRFIYFSSVAAAASHVDGILTEEAEPQPNGAYGESKRRAEIYMQEHPAKQSQKVYILRPSMIHGPHNKGNLNMLYSVAQYGIPWPLGEFDNHRSFTSIGNLAYIISALLTEEVNSGIYNICDDEPVSTNTLIEMICKVNNKKPHIWHIPKKIMRSLAATGSILHLPFNHKTFGKLTEDYIVSNKKIKEALGIKSLPIKAKDGLTLTINSLKNSK